MFHFEKVRNRGKIESYSLNPLSLDERKTDPIRYYTVLTVAVIKDSAGSTLKSVLLVDAVVPNVCAAVEDGTVSDIGEITLGKTHTVQSAENKCVQ